MTKFRHIPAAGRVIIVACAFAVFAIAGVACATSYNAIYHLVDGLGLYGEWMTRLFPALVDVAFLVAECAAILGGIMQAVTRSDEVTRGWAWVTMWLCVLATLIFNAVHAFLIGGRGDPLTVPRVVVSLLPPLLMMVAFQVLIAIVKWTMLHLGRPLSSASAFGAGTVAMVAAPPADELVPLAQPGWSAQPGFGQDRQSGYGANGGATTKRQAVEGYVAGLDDVHRDRLTAIGPHAAGREVAAALTAQGRPVDERYTARILNDLMPVRRGSRRRR